MATEYRTLNDLLLAYKDIGARHKQVHTVFIGQDFDIDKGEEIRYSLLAINPISAVLPKGDNGYSLYSSTFTIKVVDLVNKDLTNEEDVLSDSLEILKDIVTEFNQHPFYIDSEFNIEGDISFTPIRGEFNSDATGWECDITLVAPNHRYFCGLPLDALNGTTYYPDLAANVTNSDDTYNATVIVAQTLVLPDIIHIDTDGTPTPTPAQTVFTCSAGDSPSGIAYARPTLSGQLTSYRTGDDAWHLTNGTYDYTPPVYPVSYAQLDTTDAQPFFNLISNNAFGNKYRFTDINGLQVYGDNYIIDHLTGLGWYKGLTSGTWETQIDDAVASTQNGFSDWRLPTVKEIVTIYNAHYAQVINYAPFSFSTSIMSSTTRSANSTQAHRLSQSAGQITVVGKSSTTFSMKIRNHYT